MTVMGTEPNRLEIEAKIPVDIARFESIRDRLASLGARRLSPPLEEENLLLDFPDRRLQSAGQALRIRRYGKEALLTFKGRIVHHETLKKREEMETEITDAAAMLDIFRRLGLDVSFRYSKIREIYELPSETGSLSVCLDETPIGGFVEIEGPEEAILRLADLFGWNTYIRKSYVELYREAGLGQV
jgi:predicted adenylyl cyclase CyaB